MTILPRESYLDLKKKDIVLIDDDPVFCSLMMEYSKRDSVGLDYYNDLMQMGSIGAFQRYQVAIVDFQLECMNGLEIAEYFPIFFNEMPVILISGEERTPGNTFSPWPKSVRAFMHKKNGPAAILEAAMALRNSDSGTRPGKPSSTQIGLAHQNMDDLGTKDFDFSTLSEVIADANGDQFGKELIAAFREVSRESIASLTAALANSDYIAADRAAHRLRGSASNLGAVYLANKCVEFQECARYQNLFQCQKLVGEISDARDIAVERLADFVKRPGDMYGGISGSNSESAKLRHL